MRCYWATTLLVLSASAQAGAELPANGQPFENRDFSIDLAQTPVVAGTRVTGLAGAFVAIGEGVDGAAQNPAAVAQRDAWSTDHFDYDVGVGLSFSSAFANSDFFNSGRRSLQNYGGPESFYFLNLAANLQFGRWGFGVSTSLQQYAIARRDDQSGQAQADRLLAQFAITHITAGYAFHRGEWLVGVGNRSSALDVVNSNDPSGGEKSLFEALGAGLEVGILVRPNAAQFRVGLSMRSAVTATASPDSVGVLYDGDTVNRLVLPARVTLPWDVHGGVAVQLGPRPFNPRWLDPVNELAGLRRFLDWRARERARKRAHALRARARAGLDLEWAARALDAEFETESALDALHLERAQAAIGHRLRERYRGMERFYLLITSSLQLLGGVKNGVGVESFLEREVQRSGQKMSWSPRLGLETEILPNWTRARGGVYLEPSRFREDFARAHCTLGFDQKLLGSDLFGLLAEGSAFRASGSLDVARAYLGWGVALGMWH